MSEVISASYPTASRRSVQRGPLLLVGDRGTDIFSLGSAGPLCFTTSPAPDFGCFWDSTCGSDESAFPAVRFSFPSVLFSTLRGAAMRVVVLLSVEL